MRPPSPRGGNGMRGRGRGGGGMRGRGRGGVRGGRGAGSVGVGGRIDADSLTGQFY